MGFQKGSNGRFFAATVKLGPKGQIVIPKEMREMFGLEPGDLLFLGADRKQGIAIQSVDMLDPVMRRAFNQAVKDEEEEEEESDE